MKKNAFRKVALFSAMMMLAGTGAAAGCGKENATPDRDENVVNIRAYQGGYGSAFLYELEEKFNALYEDKGYAVKVLTPSNSLNGSDKIAQDMYGKKSWADLYYSGNFFLRELIDGQYGNLIYDIEDVMTKPAIGFDGVEETQAIEQKEILRNHTDLTEWEGKRYSLHGGVSVGGIVVNTEKLAKYGLELPKTTQELVDCFEAIRWGNETLAKPSTSSGVYPLLFLGADSGYHSHFFNAWVAQYEGTDWYENFWAYKDAEGNDITTQADGWKVYQSKGIEEALKEFYRVYDNAYRVPGAKDLTILKAHNSLMTPTGGVFMAEGDWVYNEIANTHKTKVQNLAFMRAPVISALGTKLFTDDGYTAEVCEEILSWVIGCADEGKTIADAMATASSEKGWTLTEADVTAVYKARGVYVTRSQGPGSWLVCRKTSDKKREICNLFLRMVASEDAAELMAQEANMKSAYSSNYAVMGTEGYWKQFADIVGYPYASAVGKTPVENRRRVEDAEYLPALGSDFENKLLNHRVSAYELNKDGTIESTDYTVYGKRATALMQTEETAAQTRWQKFFE